MPSHHPLHLPSALPGQLLVYSFFFLSVFFCPFFSSSSYRGNLFTHDLDSFSSFLSVICSQMCFVYLSPLGFFLSLHQQHQLLRLAVHLIEFTARWNDAHRVHFCLSLTGLQMSLSVHIFPVPTRMMLSLSLSFFSLFFSVNLASVINLHEEKQLPNGPASSESFFKSQRKHKFDQKYVKMPAGAFHG